jgi:hypothetical protein
LVLSKKELLLKQNFLEEPITKIKANFEDQTFKFQWL